MTNSQFHNRKSVRKKGHDYKNGSYFITICAVNREWLFGDVKNKVMVMNDLGKIVVEEWLKTEKLRTNVKLDEYVVMPNHFHAVVHLCDNEALTQDHGGRGIARNAPTDAVTMKANGIPACPRIFGKSYAGTLPVIVRAFKSAATRSINKFRDSPETPVWQRSYYEHAIRNDEELQKIRTYIVENPKHWFADEEYSPKQRE